MLPRNQALGLILSLQEKKQFAAFVIILVAVNKRVKRVAKTKKRSKAKLKVKEKGPSIRGPLFVRYKNQIIRYLYFFVLSILHNSLFSINHIYMVHLIDTNTMKDSFLHPAGQL